MKETIVKKKKKARENKGWFRVDLYVKYNHIRSDYRMMNIVLAGFADADNTILMKIRREDPEPKYLARALGRVLATV